VVELGVGAEILRGMSWLYIAFACGSLFWVIRHIKGWLPKTLSIALVAGVFGYVPAKGAWDAKRQRDKYQAAKTLFEERCKTAGEKIYQTVENVEGVLLLNLRANDRVANEANPDWPDAGLPNEAGGVEYIANFLKWEQHQDKRNPRGYLNYVPSELPGYKYVDVKSEDGSIYRYTLSDPGNQDSDKLSKMSLNGKPARYAVAFTNVMKPTDRAMWVAGTTVSIIDTWSAEVIATSTWYALEPGQGSKDAM
jgi:hypothetical protein